MEHRDPALVPCACGDWYVFGCISNSQSTFLRQHTMSSIGAATTDQLRPIDRPLLLLCAHSIAGGGGSARYVVREWPRRLCCRRALVPATQSHPFLVGDLATEFVESHERAIARRGGRRGRFDPRIIPPCPPPEAENREHDNQNLTQVASIAERLERPAKAPYLGSGGTSLKGR